MTDHWFPVWCQCRIFVVVQRKLCAGLSGFSSKNVFGQWDWPAFSLTDRMSVREGHVKYVSCFPCFPCFPFPIPTLSLHLVCPPCCRLIYFGGYGYETRGQNTSSSSFSVEAASWVKLHLLADAAAQFGPVLCNILPSAVMS